MVGGIAAGLFLRSVHSLDDAPTCLIRRRLQAADRRADGRTRSPAVWVVGRDAGGVGLQFEIVDARLAAELRIQVNFYVT